MAKIEPGHCWVSGEPVNEILSRYPQGHPLQGQVMQVGKMLPECVRVTFLMLDGRQAKLSIHKDYVDQIDLNDIWHSLIEAEWFEYTHRQYAPNFNAEQCEQAHQNQIRLLCPPLGIVDIETADEIRVDL